VRLRIPIALILLLFLPASLPAQRYGFKVYDQRSGLPNLDVRSMVQDHRGFLWVATDNGLYRYDGDRFRSFTTEDGLPAPQVEAIHETVDGVLWVATLSGMARLSGERFTPVDLSPLKGIFALASDKTGRLYVGTSKGLLIGPNSAQGPNAAYSSYRIASQTPQIVKSVSISPLGEIWYTCNRQICRLDGNQGVSDPRWQVPEDAWDQVLADGEGNVWARSRSRLIVLPKGGVRFEARDHGLPHSATGGRILIDQRGQLWATTARGLARWTPKGWDIVGKSRGLPFSSVRSVAQDREGSIWIGSAGAGLARWLGYPHWDTWTDAEGLPSESVWGLARDRQGVLWGGGDNGVSRFVESRRAWEESKLPGLPASLTTRVVEAPDGTLWLAQPTGPVAIDPQRRFARAYGKESGLTTPWASALVVDAENRVWTGTPNGLFLGERKNGRYVFTRQDLHLERGLDFHYASLIDGRGRLWVGTWGGLLRLDGQRWVRITTREGLASNRVSQIVEGRDGSLWLGYMDAVGVSQMKLDNGVPIFRHFTAKHGLRSDKAVFVGRDVRGWIWVGTDRGVEVFDGRVWRFLNQQDGLAWSDCNGDSFHADADGSVWIGTSRGASHFRVPASGIPQRTDRPDVLLLSATFGDRAVNLLAPITMPWSHRSLHVAYSAMTFLGEDGVTFRYRLAGLDDRWTETADHAVHIPSLPSGSYTFEVQASTAPDAWRSEPARLAFTIRPAWWRTWWFNLCALAAFALAAHQLWAWRIRSMLKRQKELEQAVARRTRSLKLEKAKVERERDVVADQKVEIERLFGEARQAARLKDEFLANMSHELRTPMNGIIGMTELTLETELSGEQREYLHAVRSSSTALLGILTDILDLSKVEAGKLRMDSVAFHLDEVVGAAIGNVALDARQKRLSLAQQIDDDAPRRLVGDPLRLRQVLINLLSNAVKFTEKGGISLHIRLESGGETPVLRFSITDTGIGIPVEKHALIFEPFLQGDGSHTRRHGGAGLGLTICARFVEMMQGKIWLESEAGKGSTFHFTAQFGHAVGAAVDAPARLRSRDLQALAAATARAAQPLVSVPPPAPAPETANLTPPGLAPAPPAAAFALSAPALPPPQARPQAAEADDSVRRVLLVEDNLLNQKLALKLLEKRGHIVDTAINGVEALEACDRQRYHAILMDIQMPVMGGFEATTEIRAREAKLGIRTPIIAVTAHAMEGDRERCIECGMDDYVAKPIKPADLYAAIERQTGARAALPVPVPGAVA
jgi:signal transduction histidine kinase/ligand-binding sensor domain-containing protein/ActR/RegA family two-component response regulator